MGIALFVIALVSNIFIILIIILLFYNFNTYL